jgi:hypothetical protein
MCFNKLVYYFKTTAVCHAMLIVAKVELWFDKWCRAVLLANLIDVCVKFEKFKLAFGQEKSIGGILS